MFLETPLDRLRLQKDDVLSEFDSQPFDSLTYRPSLQEWSAIEVLDHLVRTEVQILAIARGGLLQPHRIGIADSLRTRFIQAIFRSDRRVKVPATVSRVLPGSNLELPAIVDRWNDSRRELSHFVNTTPEADLRKGLFRHPVAGWMGMPQILDFFSVHIIHHNYQLSRLTSQFILNSGRRDTQTPNLIKN